VREKKKKSQHIISFLSAFQQLQEHLFLDEFRTASVEKRQLSMEICSKRATSFYSTLASLIQHALQALSHDSLQSV